MLERLLAFGLVVAVLFGVAAYLREDDAAPGGECLEVAACATAEPQESLAPACPERGCPPAPPKILTFRPASSDDERDDKDDDDDDEDRKEKRGKGRRGRD